MAAAAAASSPWSSHRDELPHVAIFPFMARGHTVPLIHLAGLLRRRSLATVTLFTTPANASFVRRTLEDDDDDVAVVELPFPAGGAVACVEDLDSISSFPAFVESVSALRPPLVSSLAALRRRHRAAGILLVADAILYWAHAAAADIAVPTVEFFATGMFAHVVRDVLVRDNPAAVLLAGGEPEFAVPEFPHVRLTLADIPIPFNDPSPAGPIVEMDAKLANAITGSGGLVVNTFDAMEAQYIQHWDRHHASHRAWPIGPLCLARSPPGQTTGDVTPPSWLKWLDEKEAAGRAVLYVGLGTLISVGNAQLREIASGLEEAGVDFIWAVRPSDADLGEGFEERVEGRGLVMREWVDQWWILRHDCVKGFLTHCGWNAVVEGISAGVPLAVWPMGVDQPLNAVLVVQELRIGVRVLPPKSAATTGHELVGREEIARVVRQLMMMDETETRRKVWVARRQGMSLHWRPRQGRRSPRVVHHGRHWRR
uniref:Glycosyltransferase n=1 Tax=Leersia perrieri TaxID=77586 RepID=A0A0D9XC74_9ORYZ